MNICLIEIFIFSEPAERVMLTGRHWVRDVFCKKCNDKLGWMYEFALEENQRYKESRVILEKALIREKDGIEEEIFTATWYTPQTQTH